MALLPGSRLERFEIIARIGVGGMGEVYRAHDAALHRAVAVKVLPPVFSADPERLRRFHVEAQAAASLNHPNVLSIFHVGGQDGSPYLVTELLEGETLRERLQRGAMRPSEALEVGAAVARGLAAAHEKAIVHRDIKPTNVFITKEGRIKILDFGLARLNRSLSPVCDDATALLSEYTDPGLVVGTAGYMSPEQVRGEEIDSRSDIFALGAVLYEMLTARRAFDGPSPVETMSAILNREPPDVSDSARQLQPAVSRVVHRCLEKNVAKRFQSAEDLAFALEGLVESGRSVPQLGVTTNIRPGLITALAVATLALLAAGGYMWRRQAGGPDAGSPAIIERSTEAGMAVRGRDARRSVSLSVLPPARGTFGLTQSSVRSAQFALAPDGSAMVFVGGGEGGRQLWIREFGRTEPQPIPGTAGASYPFWSADSRFIGFFADHWLKKVGLSGRPSQIICSAQNGRGGAWRADGTIVFSSDTSASLSRTDAGGADPVELTALGAGHLAHRWPRFLPDGRVLFFVRSTDPRVQGLYAASIDKPHELQHIRAAGSSGIYAAGQLLFVNDGELVAQPLDPTTLRLSGEAVPLGLKVSVSSTLDSAVSASNQNVLATWSSVGALSELVWFDYAGKRLGTAGSADRYVDFRLSPDDRRLALSRVDPVSNTPDLGILDLNRAALTPLPSSSQTDATPVWSADGERLVFRSNRRGLHDLFERPAHGGGSDEMLSSIGFGMYPTDWSSDGKTVIFHGVSPATRNDVWALDCATRRARPLVQSSADEAQGQLAPGYRLAYTSDESGTLQVYVRSLRGGAQTIASVNGGSDPRWRADGRELFFITSDGMLSAVEVSASDPIQVGAVRRLFATAIHEPSAPYLSNFVVTRDGRRFLLNVPVQAIDATPITVTLDWPQRLLSTDAR